MIVLRDARARVVMVAAVATVVAGTVVAVAVIVAAVVVTVMVVAGKAVAVVVPAMAVVARAMASERAMAIVPRPEMAMTTGHVTATYRLIRQAPGTTRRVRRKATTRGAPKAMISGACTATVPRMEMATMRGVAVTVGPAR